jgi:hypothetical protein
VAEIAELEAGDIFRRTWALLEIKGYLVISDTNNEFGIDSSFRTHLGKRYFDAPRSSGPRTLPKRLSA